MTALACDPGRLEAGRAGTHHDDPPRLEGTGHLMWHRGLSPCGGVVYAQGLACLVDAVQAVGGAYTGSDLFLACLDDLGHDVGVGNVGPGHADHVNQVLSNRVARCCHVVDLGAMEYGQVGLGAHPACEVQVRGCGHALDGDDLGQLDVGADHPPDHVHEVEQAVSVQEPEYLETGLGIDASRGGLVDGHAQADYVVGTHPFTHRRQDHLRKAQAILERSAEVVIALVAERRVELVEEVPVGLDLDSVHAAGLHAFGGIGVPGDDAFNVPVLGLLGVCPVGGFAQR